ncbi:caspase family protein [Erythrobacter sp. KY5]|uniref:caspase family protein n=1 Tax=Erythrobacter sp. KY5 TaxID=2011159 RepID=UPI0013A69C18|nr:caspase family protein [Erythrobacter sp. KY5]
MSFFGAMVLGLAPALVAAQADRTSASDGETDLRAPDARIAQPSAADIGITAMMQMLRDEGIDIDARMAGARTQCRSRVTAQATDESADQIERDIEQCIVGEEGIIYARAINEMNANRVNSFNDAMSDYNAQVAEAERKEREYERELQGHSAEVAEIERQKQQYERDMAAHRRLLAERGLPVTGEATPPSQIAQSSPPQQQTATSEPEQPAQQVALAQGASPPQNTAPVQAPPPVRTAQADPPPAAASRQSPPAIAAERGTPDSSTPSKKAQIAGNRASASRGSPTVPGRGRMLSQGPGTSAQEEIELAIMEASGPRIALVIGNEEYAGSMGALSNPVNDAVLIGATLRSLGFDVEILTDATQRQMKEAVRRLGDRLLAAGENATGLFYYAGHGVQSKGANFLIPVGSVVDSESDLELEAVSADAILAQLEEAYISTRIVILDACRNMPLRRRTRNGERGLARMETPNGSFVAYSTSPGSTAADGGGIHSPFAEALATQMLVPDRPIEVTFREVRRQVVEMTSGDQVPWDSSSLLETFSFSKSR